MYQIFAISEEGTENIDVTCETVQEAEDKIKSLKALLDSGDFVDETSLLSVCDFGYDEEDIFR